MKTLFATAAVLFIATCSNLNVVSATETVTTVAAARAECHKQYADQTKTAVILARGICLQRVDISVLELKQAQGDKKVEGELKRQREQLEIIVKSQKELEETMRAQAKAQAEAAKATPAPQLPVPAQTTVPAFTGAPYLVVDMPGRYVASTFEMAEMPLCTEIYAINQGAFKWFNRGGPMRVVVIKNGQPLAVIHPGNQFNEFYADLNGDGKPDRTPYKGIDPSFVDTVYTGYQKGDAISLVFLAPTGKMVAVNGVPAQVLWGDAQQVDYKTSISFDSNGRPTIHARTGYPK